MIPNFKYYLLLFVIILLASVGVWHWKQGNNEDQIIGQFDNMTLDTNETETINYKNGKTLIKNMTGPNLNITRQLNETWEAWSDSGQPAIIMTTTRKPRQIPVGPRLYNDSEVDSKWRIRMVQKLRWDLSKNFLAVSYLNLESQTMPDREGSGDGFVSVIGPNYYKGSKMSIFYGIDQPNMLIRFKQTQNGAAFCEFGQLKESILHKNQNQLNDWKWKNCHYQRKPIYSNEEKLSSMKKQFYAFCPIHSADDGTSVFTWRLANGTYNPPSRTPHCIYDFHRKATETEEYHLFKYCSKAYFFNGLDYNVSNKRMRNRRKDWILFLAEGQLKCSIGGDTQTDTDLVGKGYTVELVQYSFERRMSYYSRICPKLEATLVKYEDKMKEGKFFISAVIGGAQLDGEFRYPYSNENPKFWEKSTYFEKFKYMNFDDKLCYLYYHTFLRDFNTNRYHLELKISHFCTERGMRGHLKFNVSVGPDQVPEEGIYEDIGIQIYLDEGQMRRSTGQIIEAVKIKDDIMNDETNAGSVIPSMNIIPSEGKIEYNLSEDEICKHTIQCKYGSRCGNSEEQAYCIKTTYDELWYSAEKEIKRAISVCCELYKKVEHSQNLQIGSQQTFTNCDSIQRCKLAKNLPMREGSGPDIRGNSCLRDFDCRLDEICAPLTGECRKMNFLMHGEQCYVNSECFPNSKCQMYYGLNVYGHCENLGKFNQAAEEPNDPLD